MEKLKFSRDNANIHNRLFLGWGIIYKKSVAGNRKENFITEIDVWKWVHPIGSVRKQRKLYPALDLLKEKANEREVVQTAEEKELAKQINELNAFTGLIGKLADKLFSFLKGVLSFKMLKIFACYEL